MTASRKRKDREEIQWGQNSPNLEGFHLLFRESGLMPLFYSLLASFSLRNWPTCNYHCSNSNLRCTNLFHCPGQNIGLCGWQLWGQNDQGFCFRASICALPADLWTPPAAASTMPSTVYPATAWLDKQKYKRKNRKMPKRKTNRKKAAKKEN